MEISTPTNMPTLSLALEAAAQPILQKLKCHFFQYLKVFNDGSYSCITTQPQWDAFVLEWLKKNSEQPAVYSHIDSHTIDKNKYTFLWEPNLPKEPVMLAKEFDITNGFTFVERHADYYYMFAFAAPHAQSRALDTYFNSLNEMNAFIQHFKAEQQKLITDIDSIRHRFAANRQDRNLDKMLLSSTHTAPHITPQELTCIQELAKGQSYKEIGKVLGLSPRTVETYLNRVRQRFDLHHKKELIALLSCP